jgi:hypothetical protein
MAQHKQLIAQKAKKNAQIRQKEAQKAEADSLSRKHLSGLRVVQKNLVYVTGLTPTIREDELLKTLRGDDYFGQYGKILKIVVSKAKENAQHQQSVGVYVTFARKEDAEKCINAVDGSQNGERTLRYVNIFPAYLPCDKLTSLQSTVWYDKVLFSVPPRRDLQQPQLHVLARTWRGQRQLYPPGSLHDELDPDPTTVTVVDIPSRTSCAPGSARCCRDTDESPRQQRHVELDT